MTETNFDGLPVEFLVPERLRPRLFYLYHPPFVFAHLPLSPLACDTNYVKLSVVVLVCRRRDCLPPQWYNLGAVLHFKMMGNDGNVQGQRCTERTSAGLSKIARSFEAIAACSLGDDVYRTQVFSTCMSTMWQLHTEGQQLGSWKGFGHRNISCQLNCTQD